VFVTAPPDAGAPVADLTRLIQGAATGIGFVGAGAILKLAERGEVGGGGRQLLAYSGVPSGWKTPDARAQSAPLLPLSLRKGGLALRFFTTIATLGTPQDITLQELRSECFFPADEVTEEVARRLAGR
jgi:hypothetical protein